MPSAPRIPLTELLRRAVERLDRLSPDEAMEATWRGAILIDTRPGGERDAQGMIPGALSIERTKLEWRLDPDSPSRDPRVGGLESKVILICSEGYSSILAAATLQDMGFSRATDVVGGFEAWRDAGLPVEPPA